MLPQIDTKIPDEFFGLVSSPTCDKGCNVLFTAEYRAEGVKGRGCSLPGSVGHNNFREYPAPSY